MGHGGEDGFPSQGVYTQVAIDRNGICHPTANMSYDKITTYSSARAKMLNPGTSVQQYISTYPSTMAEKSLYVPTALIPNLGASLIDDNTDDVTSVGSMTWPYKPILLFGVESSAVVPHYFRAQI